MLTAVLRGGGNQELHEMSVKQEFFSTDFKGNSAGTDLKTVKMC